MGKLLAALFILVGICLADFLMVACGVVITCCLLNSLGIYSINGLEIAFSWRLVLAVWIITVLIHGCVS